MLQRIFGGPRKRKLDLTSDAGWSTIGTSVADKLSTPGIDKPESNILWAYVCISARAGAVSQAPLRISDGDGNIIEGGDLFDLLARPNSWQDGTEFVSEIESGMTLRNEWFIVPVSQGEGSQPDELVGLSPRNMTPIYGVHMPTGRRIAMGWNYIDSDTGMTKQFLPDEVIYIGGPDPAAGIRALDPSTALKRTFQMDMATRENNLALFVHGGMPSIALSTEQRLDPDQGREFIQRWIDNYGGSKNAHKPAILHSGMKVEKLGFNPTELQALDTLKTLTPNEICAGFRVKPAMVGLMVGETGLSQGTSTAEQKIAWWSEVGNAEHGHIAAALQTGLVNKWRWTTAQIARGPVAGRLARYAAAGIAARPMTRTERVEFRAQQKRIARRSRRAPGGTALYVWFDTTGIDELQAARLKRVEIFDKILTRGYLPDEINEVLDLGLPPHPTNTGTIPFSVVEVDTRKEDQPRITRMSTDKKDAVDEVFRRLETALTKRCACGCGGDAAAHGAERKALPEKFQKLRTMLDSFIKPREKAAASRWSRYFMEQRQRVLSRLDADRSMARLHRASLENLMEKIFPKGEEDMALVARLTPLWSSQLEDGYKLISEETGVKPQGSGFQIDDPRIKAAIKARQVQGMKANETTAEDLRQIIGDAIEAGKTMQEIADGIASYYRDNAVGEDKVRPLTAARTQTAGIINDGRLLAATDAGNLKKGWLHGSPAEPREAHLAAQDEYLNNPIALDEPFIVNGIEMMSPGVAGAPIEETANCTCMLVFIAA
jgi:HK97 family phage portal protein